MPFFRQFQHLLPDGKAWRITVDKTLRRFFEGLVNAPSDARDYVDDVYDDMFPETTRELAQFEKQFGISPGLTDSIRRSNIAAEWAATGGQDPSYLQTILQLAAMNVFVHDPFPAEFEKGAVTSVVVGGTGIQIFTGFFVHGLRVGQLVLHQGIGESTYNGLFAVTAIIDENTYEVGATFVGNSSGPFDGTQPYVYRSVDPRLYTNIPLIGAFQASDFPSQPQCTGEGIAGRPACDGHLANDPKYLVNDLLDNLPPPKVPDDPLTWPFFAYVGAETFPDLAVVDTDLREEVDRLLLKLFPTHIWIVKLIDYIQDDDFFFGPNTKGWNESSWKQQ